MNFRCAAIGALSVLVALFCASLPPLIADQLATPPLMRQTQEEADAKSSGCVTCHEGIEPMHESAAVKLGCTDCHGGNASPRALQGAMPGDLAYDEAKQSAHVQPRFPERWSRDGTRSAANPERTYTLLNTESPEFVRFINPGDLRAARQACGSCHISQVYRVPKSTMATAAVFWAAASYANGILPTKHAILGESYTPDGQPGMIKETDPLTPAEIAKGGQPFLLPLPQWTFIQPGEYFRIFERGGLLVPTTPPDIGNPNVAEDAGRPDARVSNRGRGTGLRISPAIINLHKTRLNDPHLSFLGTNDHPGDYRSSGCTACHVVYANDRDPLHSGPYAARGHQGRGFSEDKTLNREERGHPIRHRLTRAVPTSQCMSCHMHQPNSFVNTYLGYTMWDYESDAEEMFPRQQRNPSYEERRASLDYNPEGAAVHGLWTDRSFLDRVSELNPKLQHTQFADYHGHGWIFMAAFKRDRKGQLLDKDDKVVPFDDPEKFRKAVHLRDIHLERGMHCADCHFSQDEHGDGTLHGDYGASIEIECQDCHGTVDRYTNLRTSGPAAPEGGNDLSLGTTPFGRRRFAWRNKTLYQRSMVNPDQEWEVIQVRDTVDPAHPKYNAKCAYAKTVQSDGKSWGADGTSRAHSDEKMTCYACHSSWITNCFGCHLPQETNHKTEVLRYEGLTTRNYASYNPQVVRTDAYMLGINGANKGNKVAPVRSSSALVLSSTNVNRERIYMQQSTISAPGFNGQAFNPHVPHTVRTRETKSCSDCHISQENDNNAWMAQLLLQGTDWVNFIGRYAWVAEENEGFEAVAVTEWDEPQAVIGSTLHEIVYPDFYARHQKKKRELETAHHHHGHEVRGIQLRGEYLFTAQGKAGMVVYDVANIDNKGFSERIVSAPVSPVGQRTYIRTKDATSVALPTTLPMAPSRKSGKEYGEQPIHPIYRYAFISDAKEGIILTDVQTLTDGNPENNFFERALTFNPGGALNGAEHLTIAGNFAYVLCESGLTVVDFSEPLQPKIVANVPDIHHGTGVDVQFRYAFVTDSEGLAIVDITAPAQPRIAARLAIEDAHSIYVARTYAYIAAGAKGIAIVDVERPEKPFLDQMWNGEGALEDTRDVKIASTNASLFAYIADGENGLFVAQLTSPKRTPGYQGFSPRPMPEIIARRHTHGPAVALSRGLDRDRAADESGNQVAIFNRIGARPMTFLEMQRLYIRDGALFTVSDTIPPRQPESGERGGRR
jgi:hypothetical protein